MDVNDEETPGKKKYPQRNRKKIQYFHDEEFDSSFESTSRKQAKLESSGHKHLKLSSELLNDDEKEEKENLTTDVETEEDSSVVMEMSEYEKQRLKNIEENKRVMMELGLLDPSKENKIETNIIKPRHKKVNKPKEPKPKVMVEPRKKSLRLLKKTPEGQDLPFDFFQDSPVESPTAKEEKSRIEEEILPMSEDGESIDFLESLKSSLSQESSVASLQATESLIDDLRNLKLHEVEKLTHTRIQSLLVHPMESSLLIMGGSKDGELGLWNTTAGTMAEFEPHRRAINCISVSEWDNSKVFTTSHDGTVRRADLNKFVFEMAYQTDKKTDFCHVTWHTHIDANTLMVAHGSGEAGVVDLRTKYPERWFHCHARSVRTIHHHPLQPHYFVTASGTGESKIWDLRGTKKHVDFEESVSDLSVTKTKKGLTSSFFSPDGLKIVQTCNDDFIRIYDTTDVAEPKVAHKILHNNHTGRWLSVFKAAFHPQSSDLIFVGSMLHEPRRIQMYNGAGTLVHELKDKHNLVTIVPVIAVHPTLPVVVGGNSSGRAHVFTTKLCKDKFIKEQEQESDKD